VRGVVLADAHHLARQDRSEQPNVGQRPLPTGEGGIAERVLGDFLDDRGSVVGRSLDADEGNPVRAGNSA
jgi:hypothetical protein